MEYSMSGFSKLCATCEFWVGPRQPDTYGMAVILPAQSVPGKCWCLNGPHARATAQSNQTTCGCYQKWAVLR